MICDPNPAFRDRLEKFYLSHLDVFFAHDVI